MTVNRSAQSEPTRRMSGGASPRHRPATTFDEFPPRSNAVAGRIQLPCLCWLVQALAVIGRTAAAHELLTELCALATPLRLDGEEIDPASRRHLRTTPKPSPSCCKLACPRVVTNRTAQGIAGSAWVWPDSDWIAVITSVVISRRRWRRLPA
jgi:hypothetical protein